MPLGDITTSRVLRATLQDNAASTTLVASTGTNGSYQNAGNTSAGHDAAGPGGLFPGSLLFDGINDRGNFGNQFNPVVTRPFSLSIFLKMATATPAGTRIILDKVIGASPFNGWGLFILGDTANDPFQFSMNGTPDGSAVHTAGATFPSSLSTNWMHLVGTYDGSANSAGFLLYKDKVSLTATPLADTLLTTDTVPQANAMCVADRYTTQGNALNCRMAGLTIFDNRVLDQDAVDMLYWEGISTAPTIISDGGGSVADVDVLEGSSEVTTVQATGTPSPMVYSISAGIDSSFFNIDSSTGLLGMDAQSFDNPQDANSDNIYEVEVTATNAYGDFAQTIRVRITSAGSKSSTFFAFLNRRY